MKKIVRSNKCDRRNYGVGQKTLGFIFAVALATFFIVYSVYSANTTIGNNITTSGTLTVTGASSLASLTLSSTLNASSTLQVTGTTTLYSYLGVGTTSPSQLLSVHGNAFFSGNLTNVANITATGTLTVVNASTTGMLTVGGGFISSASSTVAGNLHISGNFNASSSLVLGSTLVSYLNSATSTVINSRVNAWSIATSTTDKPILSIDTSTTTGRVGIGTAAPITQFHVVGTVPSGAIGQVGTGANPVSVFVQGRYVYVVNFNGNNLQIFDVSTSSPALTGSVGTDNNPNSVYVQGRYAYVINDNIDNVDTLQIFDVSNPNVPVLTGSAGTNAGPVSVYVQGRYAYVLNSTGSTFQIFDVSNPNVPVLTGSAGTNAGPNSVYVQGRYAYVANNTGNTLQIFDVSTSSPALIGSAGTGSGPYSVYVQGRYAYVVNYTGKTLQIFDVSNPNAPVLIGSAGTGASPASVFVQGRYAYVVNNTGDTLQIFDVGGAYIQQLETGGIETGTLGVRTNASVFGNLSIQGGLGVGSGGILSNGSLSVGATTTKSTILGGLTVGTTTPATTSPNFFSFQSSTMVIEATSSASVPLTIRGFGTQTGNFLQAQNNVNTNLFTITSSGGLLGTASSTFSANLLVSGPLSASSTLTVSGLASLGGGFISSASSTVAGNLHISGVLRSSSTLNVGGVATLGDTLSVTNLATLSGGYVSVGSSTVTAQLNVSGPLSASSTLSVSGLSSLGGAFISVGSSTISNSLNVSGPLSASSTLSVASLASLNTGFISSASSTVAGNLRITGTVGIGTTTPVGQLEVAKSGVAFGTLSAGTFVGNNSGSLQLSSATAGSGGATLGLVSDEALGAVGPNGIFFAARLTSAPTYGTIARITATRENSTSGNNLASLRFFTGNSDGGNTENMRLTGAGNFGIGTTTPNWLLQVNATRPSIAITDDAAGTDLQHWLLSSQGGNFYIDNATDAYATSSVPKITLLNSGSLGVGTSSPGVLLAVHGNALISGNLNVANITATGTLTVANASTTGMLTIGNGFISSASSTISSGGLIVTGAPIQASSSVLLVNSSSAGSIFERSQADNNLRGAIILKRTRSDSTAPNADFGALLSWQLEGFTDNSISSDAGQIGVAWVRNQTNDTTDRDTYMRFSTMLDNSISEKMRLTGGGKLGIGTTTPNWLLQVADTRPFMALTDTDAGTDLKHWTLSSQGGNFYVATSSDALATSTVPALMISSNGLVGIGTSSPQSKLSIEGNCIDTAAAGLGCVDYAELYPSSEEVEPGDLLALDTANPGQVKKAQLLVVNGQMSNVVLVGAVSSNPAIVIEGSSLQLMTGSKYQSNPYKPAVALAGRIPVKVNLEGGEIRVGDPITASSEPGVGKKATESGKIVGYALDNFSGPTDQNKGKVMMFISLANWAAPSLSNNELLAQALDLVKQWLESMKVFVENGIVRLQELVAEKIIVKKVVVDSFEMKDGATGDLYCVTIANGDWQKILGECGN